MNKQVMCVRFLIHSENEIVHNHETTEEHFSKTCQVTLTHLKFKQKSIRACITQKEISGIVVTERHQHL